MDAFDGLNELLNVAAALVETTVVSAGLLSVQPMQLVLGVGREVRPAYFVTLDVDPFLHPGSIVHLAGPDVSVTGSSTREQSPSNGNVSGTPRSKSSSCGAILLARRPQRCGEFRT
jgi:hypothetical protein